jgi:uncharacterized protein YecT (DUF1311 family)
MKNYFTVLILSAQLVCLFTTATAQQYRRHLAKADSLYQAEEKEQARWWYNKAAKEGSANAHYAIAYKYVTSPKERIYHYAEAAKKGHEKALNGVLDALLFRANSLTLTDPQRALDLYHQAREANPGLHLSDEETKVRVMKESAVTENFDAEDFMKKYNITPKETDQHPFWIWKLAEEVSRPGGRFGTPDPKFLLALVVRGGFAPASKETAIDSVYRDYKKGIVRLFNICDYVTSGYGGSFCARRADEEDSSLRQRVLDSLKTNMNLQPAKLLNKTYQAASAFIDAKAEQEEQHSGSGRGAWITQSKMKQKHQFISLIDSVMNGFEPSPNQSFKQADRTLNKTYKKALKVLSREDQPFQYFTRPRDLREVQRLWIPCRDQAATLFHAINKDVDESTWKAWLTERRIVQLREIPGMEK